MEYIDLRSDTVTQPTPEMREAMANAVVGDDVFGDDPTVNKLQELAASMLGKEAAIFVPSGSMANQLAIHLHCRPGDSVLAEEDSHCYIYEVGAAAALSLGPPRAPMSRRCPRKCAIWRCGLPSRPKPRKAWCGSWTN